jgi:hypothetical protein
MMSLGLSPGWSLKGILDKTICDRCGDKKPEWAFPEIELKEVTDG